ncbi:DeoR faimly transcriptional regulator [Erythrobacter sp. SG61-1L]|uniref:diguanylate cyclase n=1 Tax=Erythrobacter sp. SG61-1L TaxID=1603897 RepID=UPI0006C90F99|nr:diguanylate cyclase [Erythrobacter sp. SG61-1L]KPL68672.1 DeoR faimly transcriptional regulator [Erythrobacter sp. SG61-1L]
MRLATITNWAYGITVALTFVTGTTMLLASNAQQDERAAVELRHSLGKATARLNVDTRALTDHARQFLDTGDQSYLIAYRRELADLGTVERRIAHIEDAGASADELAALKEAVRWADTLHDEQSAALAANEAGDAAGARKILFGPEYERELDRVDMLIARFQDLLDRRVEDEVRAATGVAKVWRGLSEVAIAVTGLLFLCVLFFVFRQRVLRPVVKLSDVVNRLAAQDFAVEPPEIGQIDEIGDMAQAIRVFRENGIERQRLESERDADLAVRDLLSRMTQRMQGCDTLDDLKGVVQRFVPEIAPARAGRLYLVDEERNAVVAACSWLSPIHSPREFPPTACWALRRGLVHRPSGGMVDVPCQHLDFEEGHLPDTLCLPLTAQRETLGLLYLEPAAGNDDVGPTPEIYLNMLAENIGLALANLQLRDALREMAMADTLTGLANRRQFDAVLEQQLDLAHREGRPLSCVMIDVDHFKKFNDTFGHDAGDAVLREVGAVLRGATREPEFVFRYGGEEFTMLLPGVDATQAAARAEEIRSRIGAIQIAYGERDLGRITASIGVACAPDQCRLSRLVLSADAALLRAKANGRDQVEVATGPAPNVPQERRAAAG